MNFGFNIDKWAFLLSGITILIWFFAYGFSGDIKRWGMIIPAILYALRNGLLIITSHYITTKSIELLGIVDGLWLFLGILVGLLNGWIRSTISQVLHPPSFCEEPEKFSSTRYNKNLEKDVKIVNLIRNALLQFPLTILWHPLVLLTLIILLYLMTSKLGVVPYKNVMTITVIWLAIWAIKNHWWQQWEWVNAFVRFPEVFAESDISSIDASIDASKKLDLIELFFRIDFLMVLYLLWVTPILLGDNSVLIFLPYYFGIPLLVLLLYLVYLAVFFHLVFLIWGLVSETPPASIVLGKLVLTHLWCFS